MLKRRGVGEGEGEGEEEGEGGGGGRKGEWQPKGLHLHNLGGAYNLLLVLLHSLYLPLDQRFIFILLLHVELHMNRVIKNNKSYLVLVSQSNKHTLTDLMR